MSRYNEITTWQLYVGLLIVLIVTTVIGVACAPSAPSQPASSKFAIEWTDAGGGLQYRDSDAYRCFKRVGYDALSCVAR